MADHRDKLLTVAVLSAFAVLWHWALMPAYAALYSRFTVVALGHGISDPKQIYRWWYLLGTIFVSLSTYWAAVIPLSWLDFHPTKSMLALRMQNNAASGEGAMSTPVQRRRFWRAVWLSLRNQLCVGVPVAFAIDYCGLQPAFHTATDTLPTALHFYAYMVAILLVQEVGFYYAHRVMHSPWLYSRVHKVHHEFVSPFAASGIACHWFEHLVANIGPVFLGPYLSGAPLLVFWTWLTIGQIDVVAVGHSGYHFLGLASGEFHDHHHRVLNECFGAMGWLDAWHGTDRRFQASMQGFRHKTLFSVEEFKQATLEGYEHAKKAATSVAVQPDSPGAAANADAAAKISTD